MDQKDILKVHTTDKIIPVSELLQRRESIHVVLDNVRSAFNVGSAFRTADAGRVEKLYLCGITPSPPNLKLSKTALGTTDGVSWEYFKDTFEAILLLKKHKMPICSVEVTNKSIDFWNYKFPKPVALVFGNEINGVDKRILEVSDTIVQIPMKGKKNSINVATSLGIVIYEVLRQWR